MHSRLPSALRRARTVVRLRIALLSERGTTTPPSTWGGTERVVDGLARALEARGHDVTVWARHGSHTDAYDVRPYRTPPGFLAAQDYKDLEEHDVIHAHWMGSNWTGFATLERLLRIHGRLVQTFHGNFPYYIRPYSWWLRSAPWKKRPQIVTQTSQQVAYARRHGVPNVERIPNPAPDLPLGEDPEDFFLHFGRITPGKGVETSIEVARRAGVRLVVAGRPDPEFAAQAVLPYVGDRVDYLGEVDASRRDELFRTARALLFPSRFPEGMPLTVLEANASGTPVISSTTYGAAADLIEEGVTGFACRSVDEMVAATRRIQEIDRRACRASVRRRFSAEHITHMHLDLYDRVLHGGTMDAVPDAGPAPRPEPAAHV